jgi:hypothetical protein
MRIGFAPAAREEEARAAARGFEPMMRWTWPVQCWAVKSGRGGIVGGCDDRDAIVFVNGGCGQDRS